MDACLNAREWREFVEDMDAFSVIPRAGADKTAKVTIIFARSLKAEPCCDTMPLSYWEDVMAAWHDLDMHEMD